MSKKEKVLYGLIVTFSIPLVFVFLYVVMAGLEGGYTFFGESSAGGLDYALFVLVVIVIYFWYIIIPCFLIVFISIILLKKETEKTCKKCGNILKRTEQFCSKCGTRINNGTNNDNDISDDSLQLYGVDNINNNEVNLDEIKKYWFKKQKEDL